MQAALTSIADLPASYVFHIGRCVGWKYAQCEDMHGPAGQRIEAIAEMVNSIDCRGPLARYPLLLENAAGQNSELGSTLESQRKLFEAFDSTAHIAFCEDTQHRFASGSCDFSSAEAVDNLMEELYSFGRIAMIHLNDSRIVEGGHVDRHEELTRGKIWSLNSQERARLKEGKFVRKLESLSRILDWAGDMGVDCICETSSYLRDFQVVAQLWPEAV
jgi:endonuclease IV